MALGQKFNGTVKQVNVQGGKRDIVVELDDGLSYVLDLYSIKEDDGIIVGDSLSKSVNELELYHYRRDQVNSEYNLIKVHRYSTFFD